MSQPFREHQTRIRPFMVSCWGGRRHTHRMNSAYNVYRWVQGLSPTAIVCCALSCYRAVAARLAWLLTPFTSVLINACFPQLAVTVELYTFCGCDQHCVGSVSYELLCSNCSAPKCLLRVPVSRVSTGLAAFMGHFSVECSTDWQILHHPSAAITALVKHWV